MKKHYLILLLLTAVLAAACGGKIDISRISPVTGIWVHDIGNDQAASDLRVVFDIFAENTATEFRIFLAKESPTTPVNQDYLETLASNFYTSVSVNSSFSYNTLLDQEQVDSDGDPISNDESYRTYVYAPELGTLTNTVNPLDLTDNDIYLGKYAGDWGDNLFSSFPISGTLERKRDSTYEGSAFLSIDFVPNFGAVSNNGSFKMKIVDGKVLDFEFSQHAPDYNGGCPGLFTGSGTVDADLNLKLNYIGDDCDGVHTDGLMTLNRWWKD